MPLSAIEYAEGRAVLQYGGELLALEDENGLLVEMESAHAAMATVLICQRPGEHLAGRFGLVVHRVLDVSAGTPLAANSAWSKAELAIVKGRVTGVHRGFAAALGAGPTAILQEVA